MMRDIKDILSFQPDCYRIQACHFRNLNFSDAYRNRKHAARHVIGVNQTRKRSERRSAWRNMNHFYANSGRDNQRGSESKRYLVTRSCRRREKHI